jgi:hypothetical protein
MDLTKLKFVKNIDDLGWAYQNWQINQEVQLNWPKGSEANAQKALQGDLILLIQKPRHIEEARVTHLVEVISNNAETIDSGNWGVIRKVRPLWVASFNQEASIPKNKDIFGWKRHRHEGPNLVEIKNIKDGKVEKIWNSLEIFYQHVACMLSLIEH